jgi:hypothetical protein
MTSTVQPGRTAAGAWSSAPGSGEPGPADRPAAAPAGVRVPGSRPSPRARTAPPAAPGPVPDDGAPTPADVTYGNSPQVSTGESVSAPEPLWDEENELEISTLQPTLHPEPMTLGDRVRFWLRALRAEITPPSVLTDPPPSGAQLHAYARWGAWTSSTGPVRKLGIVWHRLFSLPVTVICRYTEWLWQRPGRLIPVFVLFKLLISTGPGPWAADHLIRPVLGVLAWVLL